MVEDPTGRSKGIVVFGACRKGSVTSGVWDDGSLGARALTSATGQRATSMVGERERNVTVKEARSPGGGCGRARQRLRLERELGSDVEQV